MAYDNKSGLLRIIEAAGKRKEAENKLKREILKAKIQSQMRVSEAGQKERQKQKIQQESPEQQYLRHRFKETNPVSEMSIPEEGSQDTSVSFPATKVEPGKNGMMQERPIGEADQSKMFITRYNQMVQSGKKPHPAMKAVYDRYFQKVNGKAQAAAKPKEYRPSRSTQTVLKEISDGIVGKSIKSMDDVNRYISSHQSRFNISGADLDYVRKKAKENLPEKYIDRKGWFGSEFMSKPDVQKAGDVWYKKTKNGWTLADKEDYEDLTDKTDEDNDE